MRVLTDKVDSSPLLHHLHQDTQNNPTEVAGRLLEATLEAVGPGCRHVHRLEPEVGHELGQLVLDVVRVGRMATELSERFGGILEPVVLDEPARRFREKEESGAEDDGPEPLESDGDPV